MIIVDRVGNCVIQVSAVTNANWVKVLSIIIILLKIQILITKQVLWCKQCELFVNHSFTIAFTVLDAEGYHCLLVVIRRVTAAL